MAEKSRDTFWRRNNPIIWGVLATAAVIVFGAWAASQSVCQTDFWGNQSCGGSKWSVFLEAAPNEVGDTLAGFAGALAFVWLIATVWLQGQELAAQREELREQREATQDMARAQSEQVKLLQLQGEIFEEEQRQRKEDRSDLLLERKLVKLENYVVRRSKEFYFAGWLFRLTGLYTGAAAVTWQEKEEVKELLLKAHGPDKFFPMIQERVRVVLKEYKPSEASKRPKDVVFECLDALIGQFDEINEMKSIVSPHAKVRIETLLVEETAAELRKLKEIFLSLPEGEDEQEAAQ
ncbi:hypothetical protein K4F84_14280 [Phaeobacter inhibens]|uniref:hypothetical protein n=1 Tax=Phaeobacter inhibens TaxID=221822 RepID=UPI0021A890BE|nr:hypothetical protein [Phaeobacter inhibens]UWR52353.1 hypothetical protein K4F84_14280 [Phaeobacter inhibens]